MKKYIKTLLLTLTIIGASQNIKAQNSNSTNIIGTWTIDYNRTLQDIQGLEEKTYETLEIAIKDRIELSYRGRELSFFSDSRFEQKLTDGREVVGTWTISGNKLFLTSPNGTEHEFGIDQMTSTVLVLKTKEYGESKPIFKSLHFNKN